MGIDIAIVTERGEVIEKIGDSYNETYSLVPDYSKVDSPCLRFIDPYGDTVFNRLQIPLLISELEETLSHVSNKGIAAHGQKIVELARVAMENVHEYIKFMGD